MIFTASPGTMNRRVHTLDYRYLDRMANDGVRRPSSKPGEHPLCAYCGYDLFGGVSDRCPECGNIIDTHAMKEQSDAVKIQLAEFEEALRLVPLAWKLVVFGLVLLLIRIIPILGPGPQFLARTLGFLCGFVALFLRLGVVRTGRLPPSVLTAQQKAARDSFVAATDIVGALFLLGTAIVK